MHRITRALVPLLALVSLAVAATPLRADEGHCARATAVASVSVGALGDGVVTPPGSAVSTDHGCPACPATSCSSMHGCSAGPQNSPDVVLAAVLQLSIDGCPLPGTRSVHASVSIAPPTPPPLVALSPA